MKEPKSIPLTDNPRIKEPKRIPLKCIDSDHIEYEDHNENNSQSIQQLESY